MKKLSEGYFVEWKDGKVVSYQVIYCAGVSADGKHDNRKIPDGEYVAIPAPVAAAHDREGAAKDAVVEQLKNIKLLWDGGYIKAADDGLLRAKTLKKAWDALDALDKVQHET